MKKQNPVIATHSGSFHADDVAACAVLAKLFPAATLVRTRNPEFIRRAQFAVDVGGIWDPVNGRFDHHQKGFVGARSSGVVYASAGLVWAAHGQAYVQAVAPKLTPLQAARVASSIDDELMQHLDMADTGAAQGGRFVFVVKSDGRRSSTGVGVV
ncbi:MULTISPECIES: MYG1 family protein [unclassified Variovorax]|uniref:MYG1 family protein n=1 Tax=unclassified Variovorax TaxID=663243 RepID=UPI00022A684D|nr:MULTISPECIES: MYG1 family protein [unclassified Variovorax]AEO20105.1 hypothetical protein VASRS_30 [Variovorax sp. SRS16]VTU42747.1 hypothetical protein SRS16P1_00347 [Variovorax sp. SRS16]VTU42773.1 hypothetical protein E5P1_00345 [Variovorax sp. PBL-E5]VTU43792.1 hypothetical protein H6P1_00583 [Variovorax sp. PBL-H6]